jgi:hypothetical protein
VPSTDYTGPRRIFVPTVRTCLLAGEPLRVKLVTLGDGYQPTLLWRPLGEGEFRPVNWKDLSRGVYTFELPAEAITGDFEYYVTAEFRLRGVDVEGVGWLYFPATAPELNQTVVVVDTE